MFETYYSSTPLESTKSSNRLTVQDRQTFHPEHVDRGITTQLTFVASSAASSSSSSSNPAKIVGVDTRRRRSRMNEILASERTTKVANKQHSNNEGASFSQSYGSVNNDINSTGTDINFDKSSSSSSKRKIKLAKSKINADFDQSNADFDQSTSYDDTQPYEIVTKGSRSSSLSTTSSSKGSGFQRGISRLLPTPSSRRKSNIQKSESLDDQFKYNTRQFSDNTSVTSVAVSEGAVSTRSYNQTQSQKPKQGSLSLHENPQRLNSHQLANILNYCAESPFLHPERQPQREQEQMSSPNFNAIKKIFESRNNLRDCVMETIRREESDDEVDNRKSVHFRSSISSYRDDPLDIIQTKASSGSSSSSQGDAMDTIPLLCDDVSHLPDMEELLDQEMLEIECQKLIREQIMRLYEQEHYRKLGKREISSCLTTSTVNSSESSSSTTSSTNLKARSSHGSSNLSKETTKTTQSTTDMRSLYDSTTTISTADNSKSSKPSMNSSVRSMTSIGISRSHSLTDADASTKTTTTTATLPVPPSNYEIASDKDVSSEILPVTVRWDNTQSAKTMAILTKKATTIQVAQIINQALDDDSVKFETASVNRSRNIFHSLSIQPSFLSFSSKNSGSQKLKGVKKVDKKTPQRRKASSPQVKSPSITLPAFFSDRILGAGSKTTSKADSGCDVPKMMSTAKGEVPKRSQVGDSLRNTESKNTLKNARTSRNTNIIAKPKLQRSPSNSTRNTTRSAGPIDVDSVVEIYGEASSSSDQSITITYDQSSHYGRTIATSTAMLPLQSSTHHAKEFFDFLPCVIDDDDFFCPPILNEVGTIEQVSPTQLGVRRQHRLGNGLSLISSSSNVSFTCSEGGASATDMSVASEISEGPVDVDGFIPKDSYYLYDKHFIILDETDISRGLIGYEVGFEPDMANRKESKYIDYKKTSNLWKVPSAIYEDAAEEVNESEDEILNNNQKTASNYQYDNNLDDLQYFSKIVDRIDVGQEDEYDDNYRIKKTDNTCSTNMFSL